MVNITYIKSVWFYSVTDVQYFVPRNASCRAQSFACGRGRRLPTTTGTTSRTSVDRCSQITVVRKRERTAVLGPRIPREKFPTERTFSGNLRSEVRTVIYRICSQELKNAPTDPPNPPTIVRRLLAVSVPVKALWIYGSTTWVFRIKSDLADRHDGQVLLFGLRPDVLTKLGVWHLTAYAKFRSAYQVTNKPMSYSVEGRSSQRFQSSRS